MANNALLGIFRIKDLRARILFTLAILVVFRLGSVLVIPGIDPHALRVFFSSQIRGNAFVDYMDFFVGGAFSNFSVFMLGVMPYISTQILMQLALIIFPSLKKIVEEDGGRKKIQKWTRMATVVVALIQSYAVTIYASYIDSNDNCYNRNNDYRLAGGTDYFPRYRERCFDVDFCRNCCPSAFRRYGAGADDSQ